MGGGVCLSLRYDIVLPPYKVLFLPLMRFPCRYQRLESLLFT